MLLFLNVKGAFDRVDRRALFLRIGQFGVAGNIVRRTNSFMSDRQAKLMIDGRASETHSIQAGLPQGSSVVAGALHGQTRYPVRALSADGDHPTHRLLPAHFRYGGLYRNGGATGRPSSIGWMRPEKAHRLFGSRLPQQIVRPVNDDTEYGFELFCKAASSGTTPVIRPYG